MPEGTGVGGSSTGAAERRHPPGEQRSCASCGTLILRLLPVNVCPACGAFVHSDCLGDHSQACHGCSFEQLLLDERAELPPEAPLPPADADDTTREGPRRTTQNACQAQRGLPPGPCRWVDANSQRQQDERPAGVETLQDPSFAIIEVAKELSDILTMLTFKPPHGNPLVAALKLAKCSLAKQWSTHVATRLAILEGAKVAGYLGVPCWSSTSAALIVAAWSTVVHLETQPHSLASKDLDCLCVNLHAKLPLEACGLSKILAADSSLSATNTLGMVS